jgi:hypothetical protein
MSMYWISVICCILTIAALFGEVRHISAGHVGNMSTDQQRPAAREPLSWFWKLYWTAVILCLAELGQWFGGVIGFH